jgi:acyl-CoA synthetase (AMP-forming)/AMP-acid ligase II
VEAVLAGLAGVKDCAVIGVQDAATGEAVEH